MDIFNYMHFKLERERERDREREFKALSIKLAIGRKTLKIIVSNCHIKIFILKTFDEIKLT